MRQAVIYLRVSTIEQTTANQERELRAIASRMGCEIVKVYRHFCNTCLAKRTPNSNCLDLVTM
jgi:DNA invertase Pin-like site-specific DNA recombinase